MAEPETREVVLEEEADRLVEACEEIADRMVDLDPSTDLYQTLRARGNRLDTHRRGIGWALEAWDVETLTFKALTLGDEARIADEFDGRGSKPGAERIWQIALGTYDAPYLEHDPENPTDAALQETVANVATIDALAFGRWAESQIDELSAVGNWNDERSFARFLTEKQAEQSQTEE
ncbi:hypothetical protein [Salinilacihabitans rarus]|uniref:hypothetical protein n=1 Tax=Salinilacihabitans rarus TaxID=2961596 RepID=UPI0020C877D7|nr:hypothetical protein [Salinilacihabitans rarus]